MSTMNAEKDEKSARNVSRKTGSAQNKQRLPHPLSLQLASVIFRARLALFWERLWPHLWPLLMITGGFVLYLALGFPLYLPGWMHLAILLIFFGVILWRLKALADHFPAWPKEVEALARVERESRLPHNPLRTLADRSVAPPDDPRARILWERHKERLLRGIDRLRAGLPRSQVPKRDPYALRFALALVLIATFWLGGMERLRTSLHALWPQGLPYVNLSAASSIDAWLTPPVYTGKPPLVLAAAGRIAEPKDDIVVPVKSRLSIRITGGKNPQLTLYALDPDGSAGRQVARIPLKPSPPGKHPDASMTSPSESRSWSLEHVIDRPLVVVVTDGGERARWRIATVPDLPPQVRLVKTPSSTLRGGLVLSWKISDDYGVNRLHARIRLESPTPPAADAGQTRNVRQKALGEKKKGKNNGAALNDEESNKESQLPKGPLSYPPPDFDIPLPAGIQKKASGTYTRMLADHPWAGMPVILTLEAFDQGGNRASSAPHRIVLPGRVFRHPLARALVEQRRLLVRHPRKAPEIAIMLAAFTLWPQGLIEDSGVYLGLRQVAWKLHHARNEQDLREVVAALWHLATRIEDGNAADALRDLQAARRALERALEQGAPPEEIDRLMQNLRQAMKRYLQGLAEQARRQMQNGKAPLTGAPVRRLTPEDFQRMLDRLEDLARTGSRDAARQLLSELDTMLQNLQPMTGGTMPSPGQQALSRMQKLMRDQQKLMDDTYQAGPRKQGNGPRGHENRTYDGQNNAVPRSRSSSRLEHRRPRTNHQGRHPQRPEVPPHSSENGSSGMSRDRSGSLRDGTMPEPPSPDMYGTPAPRGGIQPNTKRPSFPDLAQRQKELADRLRRMMDSLGNHGLPVPETLKRSGREMERAGRALMNSRRGAALAHQRRALNALRRAARTLARRLARRQGQGRPGFMGPDNANLDPLGRPIPHYGESFGPRQDILPPESAIERARRILKALRERASRPNRPRRELDYIDRLLRGLY